jgi:Fe-S cluster assembly protein SufD
MLDLAPFKAVLAARKREPAWLTDFRRGALARFGELGLPSRRQEAWRFTNLAPLEKQSFPPAAVAPRVDPALLAPYRLDDRNDRLVLINGLEAEQRSIALGRALATAPDAIPAEHVDLGEARGNQPFAALNAALFQNGFSLVLPAGTAIDRPIEVLHWGEAAEPLSGHSRNLVDLAAGASATVIESFAGRGRYWTNDVTRIRLAEGAKLRHFRLLDEGAEAIHTELIQASLAAGAEYECFTLTLGGRLVRVDLNVLIEGEGARCAVNGAYLLRGNAEATMATFIDHAAPGGSTREIFKGVVEDRAHGVFQGKIQVRPAAQKTDAHQLNKNLLLSPRAAIDTKPELEIHADDVKCSHGATVGDLDETALFYLRARGLPAAEARRLLVEAFAAEAVDLVSDPDARTYLRGHLDGWLARIKDR